MQIETTRMYVGESSSSLKFLDDVLPAFRFASARSFGPRLLFPSPAFSPSIRDIKAECITRPWFTCSNSERELHASFTWWCTSLKKLAASLRGSRVDSGLVDFPTLFTSMMSTDDGPRRPRAREQADRLSALSRVLCAHVLFLPHHRLLTSSVILDVQTVGMRFSFHLASFVPLNWSYLREKLYYRAIGWKGAM